MIFAGIFFFILWLLTGWFLFLVLAIALVLLGLYMNFGRPVGPTGYRRRYY